MLPAALAAAWFFAGKKLERQEEIKWGEALTSVKMLAIAANMYAQDHKGMLPTAATWPGALKPYLHDSIKLSSGERHIVFNRALSGKIIDRIPEPANAVMFFEAESETPLVAGLENLPTDSRFAVSWVAGHAYIKTPSDRAWIIDRSKKALESGAA